jgi:hypothetical protein
MRCNVTVEEAGTRLSLGQIRVHCLFFLVDGLHMARLRHGETQTQRGERGGEGGEGGGGVVPHWTLPAA